MKQHLFLLRQNRTTRSTPIAREIGDMYELDLTLRNNDHNRRKSTWCISSACAVSSHQKKKIFGLIEVMGLAVLPASEEELELL